MRVDALPFATLSLQVTDEETVEVTLSPRAGLGLRFLAEDADRLRGVYVVLRGPPDWHDEPERDPANPLADFLRAQFLADLGASPLHRVQGEPDSPTLCARFCSLVNDQVNVPGLPSNVPMEFEVRAKDGRTLATRTFVLGPDEWLELELPIDL